MKVTETDLCGVLIVEPDVFDDGRGCFMESWQKQRYEDAGINDEFVQDNISVSQKGTVRGLHLQNPDQQAKLVQVVLGEVLDVAVDVRVGSKTFGQWISVTLSQENHKQLYIPAGFAHGFCVMSESAIFSYKCSDYYAPKSALSIRYDDPDIGIVWPDVEPVLSKSDAAAALLKDIPEGRLPQAGTA